MKTFNLFSRLASGMAIFALAILISCQESESPITQESNYVIEESVTDFYYEDVNDMAGLSIQAASEAETGTAGGRLSAAARTITVNDGRLTCATITVTLADNSTLEHPVGEVLIDFGASCVGAGGTERSGKIKIVFDGKRFQTGSTLTITLMDYVVNKIALEGTKVLTNITPDTESYPKFKVELTGGKATWPDGTSATRTHCFEREWRKAQVNPINDELHVVQCTAANYAAAGINRRGIAYEMTIMETLIYKRSCPIALGGIKKFVNVGTGQEIIIDYGDGVTCDKDVTVTIDGQIYEVRVGAR